MQVRLFLWKGWRLRQSFCYVGQVDLILAVILLPQLLSAGLASVCH